jgi:hypothetical protein
MSCDGITAIMRGRIQIAMDPEMYRLARPKPQVSAFRIPNTFAGS